MAINSGRVKGWHQNSNLRGKQSRDKTEPKFCGLDMSCFRYDLYRHLIPHGMELKVGYVPSQVSRSLGGVMSFLKKRRASLPEKVATKRSSFL